MEYLMPLWLRQYIAQRQKRGTSEIPEDIAQHLLHICAQALYQRDPATLIEPRTISIQQSFHRILHLSSSSNHVTPTVSSSSSTSSSIRTSKFPFSSTPLMFEALRPRDLDTLNSQEVVQLAIYVMKRSTVELTDPVLCERVHTEGEKKRATAASSVGAERLKRGLSYGSIGKKATSGGSTNNILASSIYLTKDFDIGDSVLHHRSKRPSRSLESVLSIATFCARASRPSASQEARRVFGSSTSGGSDHGYGGGSSSSLRDGSGRIGRQVTGAGMMGVKWLARLGQVVFGGPCAQAGHSHHRRTRTSLEPPNSNTNNNSSNDGASAPTEKLCKHCSGAMTCLAISILREASVSSSSTNNVQSSAIGRGKGNESTGSGGGDAKNTTSGATTTLHDSGFESGASGFELLDTAHSDDVASDTSSNSSSSSPPTTSRQLLSSSVEAAGLPRHGQSSFSTGGGGVTPRMNEDHRPQLELKHKTRIRPHRERGATPNMSSSPLGGPRSPFIVFDKSHQNDTTIRHPLEPDTDDHFSLQHQHQHDQQRVEESEAGDGNGAWSSTSSTLSDSIAAAFGLDVAARGDYRSNMRSGMSTPRVADRMDGGHEDGYNEDVPLGKWTRSRLEKDLAEALGTPVIAPLSSSSFSPVAIAQPAPTAPAQPVTSAPLAPSSFRRPSITGLGIHALTTRTNSNGSDKDEDDDQDVFHQAIDHFIHPLSTSPHPRVSPRAAPRAIPGAAPITINTTKSPALESSPSLTNSSPSNYSSPPNSPTAIVSLESPTTTMGDVATPILKPTSEDEMKNEDEGQEGEGDAGSPKMRPFYGVGIHGRATVDEYAQEVGDSMQKSPPADRSRPTVVTGTGSSEGSGDGEQKEESKEAAEATADGGVAVDGEDMTELTTADTTTDSITDNHDNVVAAEADDVEDEVMPLPKPATASNEQEEQPIAPAERRPSTLRYGAVGLHALTPSDGYVQDIEESMQRTPPVDLSRHSDLEEEKREEEKREEDESEAEEEDLVPQDATAVNITIDSGNGRDEDKQDANDIDSPTSQDNTGPTKFPEDENEVQTDNETTNTATTVTSAVDRIEVESVAAAEAKSQLATVLRYGAVGLHGKTPFDEYAHEIEESIQRGANEAVIEDRKDLASEKDDLERGSDSSTAFAQGHTTESSSPSTATNTNNSSSTRPLSSVSTLGGESTASDTSSLDYDSHDLDLDDLDSSLSSPSTTPQTSVQKELRTLRQQQRRRRKRIQLVDDAQRKKEQLDRIQAQLERRTLGKIREQVSFWETRGVLEQTVVGAEVLDDDNDDEREDKGRGGGSIGGEEASATMAKKLQSLSLTQEHLRGGNSDGARKSSGEPLSPGNTQSPGYGGMPQLAPRRSLSTSSSASSSMRPSLYFPPPAPQPSEMDSFLSNVD